MKKRGYLIVENISISSDTLEKGQVYLRQAGRSGNEGLVLWVGRHHGKMFDVVDVVIPNQKGIQTEDGICVILAEGELGKINRVLYEQRLSIIAQVHSHPGPAFHSPMDDEYATVKKIGCLSIVVPNFASDAFSCEGVAAYQLDPNGIWKELDHEKLDKLISIVG